MENYFNYSHLDMKGCFYSDETVLYYVSLLVGSVGLFLILMALFPVYSMIRKDPVAPVSLINLLISDLIQLCCLIVVVTSTKDFVCNLGFNINFCAKMVSISFMVVISMERYLCVAWPMWYKFNQNIKNYVIISLVAWLLPVFYFIIYYYTFNYGFIILISCYLLIPFPLLTFSLYKTIKILSSIRGVNCAEKLRIILILSLVLLTYIVTFVPFIMSFWLETSYEELFYLSSCLLFSSPLTDLVLYIFMRKDIFDRYLLSCCCCCKMDQEEIGTTVENTNMSMRRFSEDAERGIGE